MKIIFLLEKIFFLIGSQIYISLKPVVPDETVVYLHPNLENLLSGGDV